MATTQKSAAQLETERADLVNKLLKERQKRQKAIQDQTKHVEHLTQYIEILEKGPYPMCLIQLVAIASAHAASFGIDIEKAWAEFHKDV